MSSVDEESPVQGDARALWDAVVNYAWAEAGVAGEGNSGEFYDEKEAAEWEQERQKARTELCNRFAAFTGWRPVLIEGTQETEWLNRWELSPNAVLSGAAQLQPKRHADEPRPPRTRG